MDRRLVAIVSADVAGYSRLISLDEVGTVRTLTAYRNEMSVLVDRHHGRVVDSPGDNALLEFPSVTDAVEYAIEFQRLVSERNQDVAADRRMGFRMGVHLGEVMVKEDRIYGEGVNVAARLEAMAAVGGICVSSVVRDQVGSKIDATFTDLGEQQLKNIPQPIHAFRIEMEGGTGTEPMVVVSAGIAGFARLIGDDESGTMAAFKAHRLAADPLVYSHGGRIVGSTEDGLFFVFPSITEAVKCAAEVQALMAQRNAMAPEGRRMSILLGIDHGDIAVASGGGLSGDPVDAAVRLRALSEPGGVCLSDVVHTTVMRTLDIPFTDGGMQRLNGDGQLVRIWRLSPPAREGPQPGTHEAGGPGAVVILPFQRLGNDPDQDYLVDGITEDVTTALTTYREFRVVPRGSAFNYRDQSKSDREIARELDATYVLRGSVRAAADRVRVSAQLIDAESEHVMWAERFDRDLDDVFDLQDEIARSITLKIAPELLRGELDRSLALDTENPEAWDLFQRGKWHYYRTTREEYEKSVALLQEAIEKDPNNGQAMSFFCFVLTMRIWRGWSSDVVGDYGLAVELGERAVRLDNANWRAHSALAVCYAFTGQHDRAIQEGELSMPWYPAAVGLAAWVAGDLEKAVEYLTRAVQLSPGDPDNYHWRTALAYVHYMAGNYPGALVWAEQAVQGLPDYVQAKGVMAATLAQLGRTDEALRYMDGFLSQLPGTTADRYRKAFRFKNQAYVDHYIEGLIKAGMPRE